MCFCKGLVVYFCVLHWLRLLCFFVLSKLVMFGLGFFQYQAEILDGKNISEMSYLVSSGT